MPCILAIGLERAPVMDALWISASSLAMPEPHCGQVANTHLFIAVPIPSRWHISSLSSPSNIPHFQSPSPPRLRFLSSFICPLGLALNRLSFVRSTNTPTSLNLAPGLALHRGDTKLSSPALACQRYRHQSHRDVMLKGHDITSLCQAWPWVWNSLICLLSRFICQLLIYLSLLNTPAQLRPPQPP